MLITVAWFAAVSTFFGYLVKEEIFDFAFLSYLILVITGAMSGTLFGVIYNKPERNRWLRSLAFGTVFGVISLPITGGVSEYSSVPLLMHFFLALFVSIPLAAVAAVFTEFLRLTVQKFDSKPKSND